MGNYEKDRDQEMKYAILGGGNCYGLNLARMLLEQGHQVMGIGRSSLKGEAFTLGVERMGYQYHVYSVGPDTDFILDLLKAEKPEIIVSFAAQGEGQASFQIEHWKYFYRTNTQALVELTEKLHGAPWLQRFIQIGTSELYGSVETPSNEDSPLRPSSPYAISKAAFDLHLMSIARVCGFPGLVVRPSNAYCQGQQLHRVIPKALIYGRSGHRVPLHGGGKARKSYIHADDLSRAVILLSGKGQAGEIYNVGPQEPISIRDLLSKCAESLGLEFHELVAEAPERTGQDGCYWLDSTKIKQLGWHQEVTLETGLRQMLDWVEIYWDEIGGMPTQYRLRA